MARFPYFILFLAALITSFIPLAKCHQNAFLKRDLPRRHDDQKRQLNLCPVPCGQGWCCVTAQKCTPISNASPNSSPFECDDPILQTTWEAYQGSYISSLVGDVSSLAVDVSRLVSSLEAVYSTTFDLTKTPATVTKTSTTTNPDQGSGPITLGFGPTKTASTTATSTNNAAARAGGGSGLWGRGGEWSGLLGVVGVILLA